MWVLGLTCVRCYVETCALILACELILMWVGLCLKLVVYIWVLVCGRVWVVLLIVVDFGYLLLNLVCLVWIVVCDYLGFEFGFVVT